MVENKEFNFDLLNNEEKTLLMTFSELQKISNALKMCNDELVYL